MYRITNVCVSPASESNRGGEPTGAAPRLRRRPSRAAGPVVVPVPAGTYLGAGPMNLSPLACRLREIREEDLDDIVEATDNPNVVRWLPEARFPLPYTRTDAERWLPSAAVPLAQRRFWGIATPEDKVVGVIGITAFGDDPHKAHIRTLGYWLGESHWGRGYSTQAVREVVRTVFSDTAYADCSRIEAMVNPHNVASRRVLEKAGFLLEGIMREAFKNRGELGDTVVYSLLRSDVNQGGDAYAGADKAETEGSISNDDGKAAQGNT